MGFKVTVLLTILMRIHSAVCCSKPTCSFTASCSQADEMKSQLEEAMSLTNKVAQILKDGKRTTCTFLPEDCEDIYRNGIASSGVYTIWPRSRVFRTKKSVQVFCDMETDGGGWTVIQRRGDFGNPKSYFYRDWKNYKEGFGNITQDFWIGNDLIFALTNQKPCVLRFDLRDLEGESKWAKYDTFWIDSEEYNYTLKVEGYSGNAGDSFGPHNGRQFSTRDRDNDLVNPGNCAVWFQGAWWYNNCHFSNLNGLYHNGSHTSYADGIEWGTWRGQQYSLPFTEMKIKPVFVN